MCYKREGRTGSCQIAVTIAGVQHSRQYSFALHALFADVSIPIKGRGRAKEPVVMKGVDHWYTLLSGSIECGWRNYGEGVVHVKNVWLILLDHCAKLTYGLMIPHRLSQYNQPIIYVCILCMIKLDFMPVRTQEICLCTHNLVLSSSLSVGVMYQEHSWRKFGFAQRRRSRCGIYYRRRRHAGRL